MAQSFVPPIKIAVVGNPNVGKSCLVTRFIENKYSWIPIVNLTGSTYRNKFSEFNGVRAKITVWDFQVSKIGAQTYEHYQEIDVVFVCYSVDSEESFLSVPTWIQEIEQYCPSAFRFLVATKSEIALNARAVAKASAQNFSMTIKAAYRETSAKTGAGIDDLFGSAVITVVGSKYAAQFPNIARQLHQVRATQQPASPAPAPAKAKAAAPKQQNPEGAKEPAKEPVKEAAPERVPEVSNKPWSYFLPWSVTDTTRIIVIQNDFQLQGFAKISRKYSKTQADTFEYFLEAMHPELAKIFLNGEHVPVNNIKKIEHRDKIGILSPPEAAMTVLKVYEFRLASEDEVEEYLKRTTATYLFPVHGSRTTGPVSDNTKSEVAKLFNLGSSNEKKAEKRPAGAETPYISYIFRKPMTEKEESDLLEYLKYYPDIRSKFRLPFTYDTTIAEERTKPLFAGWIELVVHEGRELPVPLDRRSACTYYGLSSKCKGTFGVFTRPINCAVCGEVYCVACVKPKETGGKVRVCEACFYSTSSGETVLKRRYMTIQRKTIFIRSSCTLTERPTIVIKLSNVTNGDTIMQHTAYTDPEFQDAEKLFPNRKFFVIKSSTNTIVFTVKDTEILSWRDAFSAAMKQPEKPLSRQLLVSCFNNKIEETRQLLNVHDPDSTNQHGTTPLIRCGKKDSVECAALLLQSECSVNIQDKHGRTALHWAAFFGNPSVMPILLQHGIDLGLIDGDKRTAIALAKNEAVKQKIIEFEQEILNITDASSLSSKITQGLPVTYRNSEGITLLQQICEKRSEDCLKLLIMSNQIDLDQVNCFGETALHICVSEVDWFEGVKLLLTTKDSPANPNIADINGFTPLHLAAMNNFEQSTKLLLEHKADPFMKTRTQKSTALHLAVMTNAVKTARILLQRDNLWKETDLLQQTPLALGRRFKRDSSLIQALQQKSLTEQLFELCQKPDQFFEVKNAIKSLPRFEPNEKDQAGDTLLHVATRARNLDCVKYLLELQCSPTVRNIAGETCIDIARNLGDEKTIGYFNENIHIHSLRHAMKSGNVGEVKRLLQDTPVNVNGISSDGSTILHYAAKKRKCNFQIVQLLLEKGAFSSIHLKEEHYRRTPLAVACLKGNMDFIREILSWREMKDDERAELVNDVDYAKDTLLHLLVKESAKDNSSAKNTCVVISKMLLQNGARIDIPNADEKTVVDVFQGMSGLNQHKDLLDLFFIYHYGYEVIGAARAGDFSLLEKKLSAILDSKQATLLEKIVNIQDYTGKTALHYACSAEERETCVAILLTYKANPDVRDEQGKTCRDVAETRPNRNTLKKLIANHQPLVDALTWAAEGSLEKLKGVYEQNPELDINSQQIFSLSVIHMAAWIGKSRCLKYLIKKGANINIRNSEGDTPLSLAIRSGNYECILLLQKAGAVFDTVNYKDQEMSQIIGDDRSIRNHYQKQLTMLGIRIYKKYTPLEEDAKKNIKTLLDSNKNAQEFIHYVKSGSTEALRIFIKQQPSTFDVTTILKTIWAGHLPLFYALESGNSDVIGYLLQCGAVLSEEKQNAELDLSKAKPGAVEAFNRYGAVNELVDLCIRGDSYTLSRVLPQRLQNGFDINFLFWLDIPLLNITAYAGVKPGHVECIIQLIQAGCNVNQKCNEGLSALHWAALNGNPDIMEALLDSGKAEIDAKDNRGFTPLTVAALKRHTECVSLLIKHKAQPHVPDQKGRTALMLACKAAGSGDFESQKDWKAICSQLILHGSEKELEKKNTNGKSVLHYIVKSGQNELLKDFLQMVKEKEKNRASKRTLWLQDLLDHQDKHDHTALSLAVIRGDLQQVKTLGAAGAKVSLGRPPPLFIAVHKGYVDVVKLLLDKEYFDANPNMLFDNWSPLLIAVTRKKETKGPADSRPKFKDNSLLVRALLEGGADPTKCSDFPRNKKNQDHFGYDENDPKNIFHISPFDLAQFQRLPHDNIIIKHVYAMKLQSAIQRFEAEQVKKILKESVRFDIANYSSPKFGKPIEWAIKCENIAALKQLLLYNPAAADIEYEKAKENEHVKAAILQAFEMREQALKLFELIKSPRDNAYADVSELLETCTDLNINFTHEGGNTPLHVAVMYSRSAILQLLLNYSGGDSEPNPFVKNFKRESVFDIAFANYGKNAESNECVERLIQWFSNYSAEEQKKKITRSLLSTKCNARSDLIRRWKENNLLVEESQCRILVEFYFKEKKDKKEKKEKKDKKKDNATPANVVYISNSGAVHQPQPVGTESKQKKSKKLKQQLEVSDNINFAEIEEMIRNSTPDRLWYRLYTKSQNNKNSNKMPISNQEQWRRYVKSELDYLASEESEEASQSKVIRLTIKPSADNTPLSNETTKAELLNSKATPENMVERREEVRTFSNTQLTEFDPFATATIEVKSYANHEPEFRKSEAEITSIGQFQTYKEEEVHAMRRRKKEDLRRRP